MHNLIDEIKQRIGATQLELSKYVKIQPIEIEDRKGYVSYGESNSFPQYTIELYNESPVHGSIVNSIAFMIAGQEFTSDNPQATAELKRLGLDKIRHNTALDLKLHGGFYWEIIWSMDRSTIAQINHLPYENCRLCVSDENDDINGIYYSRDWNDTRKKKNTPSFIPMFNPEYKDELPKQVLFVHSVSVGSEYYPKPDYIGGINYIELTRQISEYHVNNILNGFFPSLITSFNNGIPSLEEQRMIKNQLQQAIQGAENAGKVLTFFNEDRDRGVEFTAFPISDADKQYEFLSEESTKQILISHRVTSPLLFGIRDGGGLGSNTDEMKQAMWIFTKQVIEPFQRMITDSIEYLFSNIGINATIGITQNDLIYSPPASPTEQSEQKKKTEQQQSVHICQSSNDFSDEQGRLWIEILKTKAEFVNSEEWELISEEDVDDPENESKFTQQFQASLSSYDNSDDRSNWGDTGLYKLRYAYSQNLSENSREFCVEMVRLSKAGASFRYEDIQEMSNDGVNGQFAPSGQSKYNIFLYLGGCFCHHRFKRQIYYRKRDSKGRILPNKGLENDKRVGDNPYVPKKGLEGIAPIDRADRGSLKYG